MSQHRTEHCMICRQPLLYGEQAEEVCCTECGATEQSAIICPAGHYICNRCHSAQTLARIPEVLARIAVDAPEDILEELLTVPGMPMHGPEHHALAGLALLKACEKLGISLSDDYIDETIRRCSQIPGGACGYLGACGGPVSLGVAVSMVTRATPLSGLARGLANRATAAALLRCGDDDARCCKRAVRKTVVAGRAFFADELNIDFPGPYSGQQCHDISRNHECARDRCPCFKTRRTMQQSAQQQ